MRAALGVAVIICGSFSRVISWVVNYFKYSDRCACRHWEDLEIGIIHVEAAELQRLLDHFAHTIRPTVVRHSVHNHPIDPPLRLNTLPPRLPPKTNCHVIAILGLHTSP